MAYFKCKHLEIESGICVLPGKLHTTVVQVELLLIQDFQISFVVNVDKIQPKICTRSHNFIPDHLGKT